MSWPSAGWSWRWSCLLSTCRAFLPWSDFLPWSCPACWGGDRQGRRRLAGGQGRRPRQSEPVRASADDNALAHGDPSLVVRGVWSQVTVVAAAPGTSPQRSPVPAVSGWPWSVVAVPSCLCVPAMVVAAVHAAVVVVVAVLVQHGRIPRRRRRVGPCTDRRRCRRGGLGGGGDETEQPSEQEGRGDPLEHGAPPSLARRGTLTRKWHSVHELSGCRLKRKPTIGA